MNVAFLSLGGNLGRRLENINNAVEAIRATGAKIISSSSTYETAAWGSSSDKKFLNRVICIKTPLNTKTLLKELLRIETGLGRTRTSERNSDRTIDIDILFFNDDTIDGKHLQIPHPRLHLRKFVLVPLNEIAGSFRHPALNQSIRSLLKNCEDPLEVTRYKKPLYICIEGNIGSGKTTIAKALAKKLNADFLPELFGDNYFLPLFYEDPQKYAFHAEYSFFMSRLKQQWDHFHSSSKTVVSDYSIYKSLWFSKINLPKKEYPFFRQKITEMLPSLPEPDLIIYLDTTLKNLKLNITKRNRPYEKSITTDYLRVVGDEYKKGINRWPENKRLTLYIDNYDSTTVAKMLFKIREHLKENV